MKLTPILALATSTLHAVTDAQKTCDVLTGLLSLDTQADECCGATTAYISALMIEGGMAGMFAGKCLHMTNYAEYFPEGCTDCKGPNDSQISKCTPGSSPKVEVFMAALTVICCNEYTDYGGLCQTAILKGVATGSGAFNAQVGGGMDPNKDGLIDYCSQVTCDCPAGQESGQSIHS